MSQDLRGHQFAESYWRFSAARAAALAKALDYPVETDQLPPTLAFSADLDGGIVDQLLALTGLGEHQLLHGEQHFEYHRPLQPDTGYRVCGVITDVQRKAGLQLLHKQTQLLDEQDRLICTMRSIYVGIERPIGPRPAPALGDAAGEAQAGPLLDSARIAGFAQASGDHNPVHLDPAVARRAGHADVFAQGMLGMGLLGSLLLRRELCSFGVRFVSPIPVNERPQLYCTGGATKSLLLASSQGDLRIKGYAHLNG